MITRIPLHRITDNPFQSRLTYNVSELADAILRLRDAQPETSGLLQVPAGRIVNASGDRVLDPESYGGVTVCLASHAGAMVQIAAGHRRLRAFRHLNGASEDDYDTFPVRIQHLDDEAMADISRAENEDREDLSPVEEAMAIQKTMDHFSWNQTQLGERWGITQATVANKLRLLALPRKLLDRVHSGELNERQGRALLPLLQIPGYSPATTLFTRPDGTTRPANEIDTEVRALIEKKTRSLKGAAWLSLVDWLPAADNPAIVGGCNGCALSTRILRQNRCLKPACYQAKKTAWHKEVAAPEKARKLHEQHARWEKVDLTNNWIRCQACDIQSGQVSHTGWYKSDGAHVHICPSCWALAELPEPAPPPPPPEMKPIPAPTASPEYFPGNTPLASPPVTEPPPFETTATAPPVPESTATTPPPVPESTATTPPPAPGMRPIPTPPPVATPPPPPAAVLTARILPGDHLPSRRVMLSIGAEGQPPATLQTGKYAHLSALITSVCRTYFENGTDPTTETEPIVLKEVPND